LTYYIVAYIIRPCLGPAPKKKINVFLYNNDFPIL
jgi:hypothetical protein